ncbi:hypothetical protein [Saccharopolyspora sp. NPDC002376]
MSRSQHHKALRLRLIPAALGIGAIVALGGCSAGQVTETDTQVAAVNGGNGQAQQVSVRNAMFTFPTAGTSYPAGSSAPLEVVLANEGPADKLVEVTSPYTTAPATVSGITELPSYTALHAVGASPELTKTSGERRVEITLNGFKQDITAGVTVPVTFVFENAGQVTVQVPIGTDHSARPDHGGEH